jgi:hypothetical protein
LNCDTDLTSIRDPIFSLKTNDQGEIDIMDLEYGAYTILFRKKNFQANCENLLISKKKAKMQKFLAPLLKEGHVGFLIEWNEAHIMMNLYASYINEIKKNCAVGFEYSGCGGMKYYFTNQTNTLASYVEIELREYTYLIFLKPIDLMTPKKSYNRRFFYSNTRISYYLSGNELPNFFWNSIPMPSQKKLMDVMESKNLAYFIGCLKPRSNNDELLPLEKAFWIDQDYKRNERDLPDPQICNF